LARTICRRAERAIVALKQDEEINPIVLRFINRLSDYLFVAARFVNAKEGHDDIEWKP
jgi:cob(I)alamin adenosyltransferase